MNRLWLGWVMAVLALPASRADVLDDLGVSERDVAMAGQIPESFFGASGSQLFIGFPLSAERVEALAGELAKLSPVAEAKFQESRGNHAWALECGPLPPLDHLRLLVRAGRMEEARGRLAQGDIDPLIDLPNPQQLLISACRPMEDAGAWDELRTYLQILEKRLDTPAWLSALWAEELDVAWHLDAVDALLAASVDEPVRLAYFHHRLGNHEERERIVIARLETASPAEVAQMLILLQATAPVKTAALALWERDDLEENDRMALLDSLIRMPAREGFDATFLRWLRKGGNALPMAGSIWSGWSAAQQDTPQRRAILTAIDQAHPEEPRFQLLLARQVMKSHPGQAADLFEKLARLPLKEAAGGQPSRWLKQDLRYISEEHGNDLPYLGLTGLGLLNRQDRVHAVIGEHPDWERLPMAEQIRYLAAGRMDIDLLERILTADFSQPEHDKLTDWLTTYLEMRLRERPIPGDRIVELAAKAEAMAKGSSEKAPAKVRMDGTALMNLLAKAGLERDQVNQLAARLKPQAEEREAEVGRGPNRPGPPLGRGPAGPPARGGGLLPFSHSRGLLALFSPPQIHRVGPVDGATLAETHARHRPSGIRMQLPLALLDRWSANLAGMFAMPRPPRPAREEDQAVLQSLMLHFEPGSPQRLLAEILIAKGQLTIGDAKLAAESEAGLAALMAGQLEPRGTEKFRYVTLAMAGAQQEELLKVLAELNGQPPSVRARFLNDIRGIIQSQAAADLARRELGALPAGGPRPPDPEKEQAAELEGLLARDREGSPAAVRLAKKLLDDAARRPSGEYPSATAQTAVLFLERTGELKSWVAETRADLLNAGIPEVEVLRRLQHFDGRGDPQKAIPYAREILNLDPSDTASARLLLRPAAEQGDRELFITCLWAIGADGLLQLSAGDIVGTLRLDAAGLFSLVLHLSEQAPGGNVVTGLHQYFLFEDPKVAAAFREWVGGGMTEVRRPIAEQLLAAGRRSEAVELIAAQFVTPTEYPGFPHQFPPSPGAAAKFGVTDDFSYLKGDVDLLRQWNLLEEVIERIGEIGKPDPQVLVTLQMAATPDAATFEKYAVPLLAAIAEPHAAPYLVHKWLGFFQNQPGTASLQLRLLKASSDSNPDRLPHMIINMIERASVVPGGNALMAELWQRAVESIKTIEDPNQQEMAWQGCLRLLRPILFAGDDATWSSYWEWRRTRPEPMEGLGIASMFHAPSRPLDPARLRDVLPRALEEMRGLYPPTSAPGMVLAAAVSGDPELLEKVKQKIPADDAPAIRFYQLAKGFPAGISPVIGGGPVGDGEIELWWNLVGTPAIYREDGGSDIPCHPFPSLDGLLELRLLAGAGPERKEVVRTIPAAAAAGHIRLKLPPEDRYVAMTWVDENGEEVGKSETRDVATEIGLPLPLSDAELTERRFERLDAAGPGGLPAWKVRLSKKERVDLLEREWVGGQELSVSAWVSGDGKLAVRCLDSLGRELQVLDLVAGDTYFPLWQFQSVRVPGKLELPAGTARLVLVASDHGAGDDPKDFAFSDARLELRPRAELSQGFEKVATVRGAPSSVALSPDSKRLAIALTNGPLLQVELESGLVSEIPLRPSPDGSPGHVVRCFWPESGLHFLTNDGFLHRADRGNGAPQLLLHIPGGRGAATGRSMEISKDGKWLAWLDPSGGAMVTPLDGEIPHEVPGNFSSLHWVAEGLVMVNVLNRRQMLLRGDEIETGEPVELELPLELPTARMQKVIERLRAQNGAQPGGQHHEITTPSAVAVAEDGTIYLVDPTGSVIREVEKGDW